MSDYRTIETGSTNARLFTIAARDGGALNAGAPITTGTVNHYLKALSGANIGKWYRASDGTWQAAETANAMTHQADGHWTLAITSASPFTNADTFLEYAKESADAHIPVARILKAEYTPSANSSRRVDVGSWLGVTATDNTNSPGIPIVNVRYYNDLPVDEESPIAKEVWWYLTTGPFAAPTDSFGALVIENLDASISSRPDASAIAASVAAQISLDHGNGSYVRNTEPPTTGEIAGAVAAQVTSDHGNGSYVRNTEPPTTGEIASAVAAQITSDHGSGSYAGSGGGSSIQFRTGEGTVIRNG